MTTSERRVLELALIGLDTERSRIDQEMIDIRRRLGPVPVPRSSESTSVPAARTKPARSSPNKGRRMTNAQKRAISRAMKARWAALKPVKKA